MQSVFRASVPVVDTGQSLGPLTQLPGTWMGNGFNLIARPDKEDNQPFFLELNATRETTEFTDLGGLTANRGSVQNDIFFDGVSYLQRISDAVTNGGLHIEPGMWLNVPATTDPAAPASVVRLATIPHGNAVLAQGSSTTVQGPPQIGSVSSTPTNATGPNAGQPITGAYVAPYTTTPLPPTIPQGAIANPNLVLTTAIQGQKIVETTVLTIDTTLKVGGVAGGIESIPFVVDNASPLRLSATFWIEIVEREDGLGQFVQLQYSQLVVLNFLNVNWPHIQVATLVKQ